jgi:hypothetical protein
MLLHALEQRLELIYCVEQIGTLIEHDAFRTRGHGGVRHFAA